MTAFACGVKNRRGAVFCFFRKKFLILVRVFARFGILYYRYVFYGGEQFEFKANNIITGRRDTQKNVLVPQKAVQTDGEHSHNVMRSAALHTCRNVFLVGEPFMRGRT